MQRQQQLENAAIELLKDAVQPYADVQLQPPEDQRSANRSPRLLQIQPNSVPPTTTSLLVGYRGGEEQVAAGHHPIIWVLNDASPELRQELQKNGESYVDIAGAIHLRLPGLVVDRTDLAPISLPSRSTSGRNPFADQSSKIARTLLSSSQSEKWSVTDLANSADVAYSTAWYVTKALEERGLIHISEGRNKKHIQLGDPQAIIREWTSTYRWSKNHALSYHAPIGNKTRFLHRLSTELPSNLRWALTLHAGAHLVAPHATWESVHLYIDAQSEEEILELGSALGTRPGEEGRLVLMAPYYKSSVWHNLRRVDDTPVVSTLQLALDLWHYPVRGREQAEHLIESLLEPIWYG